MEAYEALKKIIRQILPFRVIIRQEERLRKLYSFFYRGSRFQCPLCDTTLRTFIRLSTGDKLCPACGSLGRDRRLWKIVQPYLTPKTRVLDFSPSRSLYRKLMNFPDIHYTPTDRYGDFLAVTSLDITGMEVADESYDLVICYHVLEHIESDEKAMKELYRVLSGKGRCFIQTPFKEGAIYEDPGIKNAADRKRSFGQQDHVRIYSVEGLAGRLVNAGFQVERLDFSEKKDNYFGYEQKETVLMASKMDGGAH